MHPTSHFIGISVDSTRFVDLFIALQQYFEKHKLSQSIEYQNILSLHITLYYLEAILPEDKRNNILKDAEVLSIGHETIRLGNLSAGYFGDPGKERICYAGSAPNPALQAINDFLVKKYQDTHVDDNQLDFVSHISLFRINDPMAYAPHKPEIDRLINKELEKIDGDSLLGKISLFQVSSLFQPEIQIAVTR